MILVYMILGYANLPFTPIYPLYVEEPKLGLFCKRDLCLVGLFCKRDLFLVGFLCDIPNIPDIGMCRCTLDVR